MNSIRTQSRKKILNMTQLQKLGQDARIIQDHLKILQSILSQPILDHNKPRTSKVGHLEHG